ETSPAAAETTPPPKASTTQRVRVEVQKQTRKHRRISTLLVALLVVAIGTFGVLVKMQKLAQEEEIRLIQAQVDSVLDQAERSMALLEGRMTGLAQALTTSQQNVRELNSQLASARGQGNDLEIQALSEELDRAMAALAERQLAAGVDFREIARNNQRAVAMLFAEFRPGHVETATAFAIRSDGIMVTNRHAVAGPSGNRPALRLAVRFDGSNQNFRVRTIAISDDPDVDLAIIKVELAGEVPVVRGINDRPDSLPVGSPVAVLGFPGGLDSPQLETEDGVYAAASLTAGTVSKNLPNVIQVNGYGSPGASGSPVFDATGRVVAVIFGGEGAAGGRLLYAVPAGLIADLMSTFN
ncbi:MAG: trypsin-like peptidase domain-containing protein, partial [Gemmatimonadota bacterium]|nr:trypsin-like peptidase domain-containing protein [Gemmatimonadota bacterium]